MKIGDFIRGRFAKKTHYDPERRLNVLIEVDSFDKGGLQKVVYDTATALNPALFRVIIVVVNREGYWAEQARSKGVETYLLGDPKETEYYRNIIIDNNIDLACSHFSRVGYSLFCSLRIPNITYIHNVYAFLSDAAYRMFRKDDKMVDLYISVSQKATDYAVERLKICREKIVTIANGLILEEHEKRSAKAPVIKRSDFGLKPSDYVFLNVASYNLHKGHYLMAEIMELIKKKRNDIKVLCVGNVIVPAHVKGLFNHLKKSNLDDVMIMPGYYPNIESFYKMADAFLLPSFIEGWSIAMNEAMFYGMPMILSDTGGAAEVITNNDIGIVVENEYGAVGNLNCQVLDELAYSRKHYSVANNYVTAMCDFADNPEKWKRAGERGRLKLKQKYNFVDVVRRYERVYLQVLKEVG